MPENINQEENQKQIPDQNMELSETSAFEIEKKVNWRSFLKISGFTIVFSTISIISMIIGLIIYYKIEAEIISKAGLGLIIAGVLLFLFTVIFGFEKIER